MIRFSDKQWERVQGNYRKWWKGELDRYLEEILRVVKQPEDLIKMQISRPRDRKDEALRKLSRYYEIRG